MCITYQVINIANSSFNIAYSLVPYIFSIETV